MEEKWQFRRLFTRIYAAAVVFVSVILLTVMTIYAGNKVVIVEDSENESELINENESVIAGTKWKYNIEDSDDEKEVTIIPLPAGISESSVDVSIRYDKCEIKVSVDISADDFFHANPPFGNFDGVKEAFGESDGEKVYITLLLDDQFFCDSDFVKSDSGSELELSLTPVKDEDRKLVIIDPSHGGNSMGTQVGELAEKDILLKIAKLIERKANGKAYRIVFTRETDIYVNTETKIDIIKRIEPDYYIGLQLAADIENVKKFGMYAAYNGSYYRHGIQNVSFADAVLKAVCEETVNRGIGITEATEDDAILMTMAIPGMVLYAGHMSNEEECALLYK